MSQLAIFWPVIALAALTLVVLLQIVIRRFMLARKGEVTQDDFRLGESSRVPEFAAVANRNYVNLLEMPVLFYVVCVSLFVAGMVTPLLYGLAWAYVALRAVHTAIHITVNHVVARLAAFALSNLVLVVMWVLFGLQLAG
ncbi:MAG: MAPEG family protein [Henriciella sp.]|uniref:MAPEG family protein n=1 Tax=Henriciella sp. TaxID=1968823 RepID=UPI003C720FB6